MKKSYRVTALLLVLACCLSLLSGCATKPYVVEIDGVKIRQGIFAYYYGYCYAAYYDTYGDDGVTYYTFSQLTQHVAVNKLFDEFGLKLSDEDKNSIENSRSDKIEELGGQSGYAQYLRTIGLTDKLYREILAIKPKYNAIEDYLFGEGGSEYKSQKEIQEEYASYYVHETHIFISTSDVDTVDDRDALRAKADEAYQKAVSGEDFLSLIKEYGEDDYLSQNPEAGYYFAEGDLGDTTLEDAIFALDVGEISDVIEGSSGFYICKRMPIEQSYLDSVFEDGSMYDEYTENAMNYYVMTETADYDVEYLDDYYDVNFSSAVSVWQ